ncbi:MAG: bacteriohemerythrin [Nitrospirae bacterium]|nr:MAG: bacteriohemerythrin [Nitrospirota bacterium]
MLPAPAFLGYYLGMLKWTDDLLVGIDSIDDQHKELFDRIGKFYDSIDKGLTADKVSEIMDYLADYANTHFTTEESYMSQYGYPEYSYHKDQHHGFISDLYAIQKRLNTYGFSNLLGAELEGSLYHWLVDHVSKVDKKLAKYLKDKIKA